MSIFEKRVAFKPFEYDVEDFKHAINQSFWIVQEFNFTSDVQDFYVELNEIERNAIKNAMLVGEPKEYKGISYRMNQMGNYECLNLPPVSGLDGAFTSTQILHSIIDKMDADGTLPKTKVKSDK